MFVSSLMFPFPFFSVRLKLLSILLNLFRINFVLESIEIKESIGRKQVKAAYGTKYSRMDLVKFVEDSPSISLKAYLTY